MYGGRNFQFSRMLAANVTNWFSFHYFMTVEAEDRSVTAPYPVHTFRVLAGAPTSDEKSPIEPRFLFKSDNTLEDFTSINDFALNTCPHFLIPNPDIALLSTLVLRPRLLGGGGDGGATGAESRDCYLNMYAVKKPDKRLPKHFSHIKGLKDMINMKLEPITTADTAAKSDLPFSSAVNAGAVTIVSSSPQIHCRHLLSKPSPPLGEEAETSTTVRGRDSHHRRRESPPPLQIATPILSSPSIRRLSQQRRRLRARKRRRRRWPVG
ncbi:hypothetical protein Tsubulata_024768 [Turnera subulata]|uniref:Uncharacterized protein n=1 Tax=Turnera subulata TaxID=218843 RepID=A0A9Q0J5M0_9ROSI|nr:hypothetical protein Tsubulata_024768 [Turnera subulata]